MCSHRVATRGAVQRGLLYAIVDYSESILKPEDTSAPAPATNENKMSGGGGHIVETCGKNATAASLILKNSSTVYRPLYALYRFYYSLISSYYSLSFRIRYSYCYY